MPETTASLRLRLPLLTTAANNQVGDVIRILPATAYVHKGLACQAGVDLRGLCVQPVRQLRNCVQPAQCPLGGCKPSLRSGKPYRVAIRRRHVSSTSKLIHLYWTAPDDGGQDVTAYEIEVSDTKGHWPSQEARDDI